MKCWYNIETILQNQHIRYRVFFTRYEKHATALTKKIVSELKTKAIIAVGGDGTVHEVINGLVGSSIPLGVIPAGSGNDFCRAMRIPFQHERALNRILNDKQHLIDIGNINGKLFGTVAGVGLDGYVAFKTNESQNKKLLKFTKVGSLAYIFNLLKVLFLYKPTHVELNIDGKQYTHQNVWFIAVANTPCYAGGMMICPYARNDDQLFDICIFKGSSRLELLRLFPSVFKGKHIHDPSVIITSGKEITITSNNPMTAHGDGEVIGHTPVDIQIMPSTLSIL